MAFMGVVRGFGLNGKSLFSNVSKPCEVNLQFTVAAADTGGLGITSLKSNGYVNNVFMHTSQTPGSNNGFTNPNPAVGFIAIQLQNNFQAFLGMRAHAIAPNSGSAVKIDNSAMTAGQLYTITTLGDATLAKWQAIGVPVGVVPAVGVSFIALSNGGTGNTLTSRVQAPSVSGVESFEVVGTPNVNVNGAIAASGGQWIYLQALGATSSSVTTLIPAAPADGTVIKMKLYFDGSSVTVDGL